MGEDQGRIRTLDIFYDHRGQLLKCMLRNIMNQLKLGIPKGSLESATVDLFAQAGLTIQFRSRNYFLSIDDDEITCSLVRSQEMGPYVAGGTMDVGLCGIDWIKETQADVEVVCDLVYSKASDQPCRWVLVVVLLLAFVPALST